MDDMSQKVLLVVFGWLLGLLGPVIVDSIKRRRENALGRRAIRSELRDVAHKLAFCHHMIQTHLGKTSRDDLTWMKSHLEGHAAFEDSSRVLTHVNASLQLDDYRLSAATQMFAAEPGNSLELQKYPVPLLDSRVSALWSFDTMLQRTLLEIRTRISQLDRIVDKHEKSTDKTFTEMAPENRRRLEENITTTLEQYAKTARIVVDLVKTIERT
jgi:hypothetical protein